MTARAEARHRRAEGRRPKPARRRRRSRVLALAGLHLAVLWSFAFAQPLLDLLGDAPEFFVARENTRADILLLAFGVALLPPLLLTGVEAFAAGVSERLRRRLHLLFVSILAAAFALQLLNDLDATAALLIAVAAGLGGLAALAYARTHVAPLLLSVLAPMPLVFLFVFLVLSPVSKLVLPGGEVQASSIVIPNDAPVVMIVFDEFSGLSLMGRDHRINAARYPSFARLARDSTWYRNATTVADFTDRAVPALLTGERPDRGAIPIAQDHPESLFTLLGGKYSFDVKEPVTDVCPQGLCPTEKAEQVSTRTRLSDLWSDLRVVSLHLLLPEDLRRDLPPVDRSFGDFRQRGSGRQRADQGSPGAAARGLAAVAAISGREQEFRDFAHRLRRSPKRAHLSFLHLQLPHSPYTFLPSGQQYPDALVGLPGLEKSGQPGGVWGGDRRLARQAHQRYVLQAGYADRLVGQTLDRLRSAGLYDRSLVIVTADHGASFRPGTPHRAVTERNLAQIASIPLLVKAPGQHRGRIDDGNVKTTDVLPTVAARLGVRLPWSTDGRSVDGSLQNGTVAVQPHRGESTVALPFDEYVRRRDALVDDMVAELGESPAALYRAGPDPDLVGRPVDSLPVIAASGGRFELDGSGLLASVDPRAARVPALLTGQVVGVPPRARLAVAVEGRIAAVTSPFRDGDLRRFSALVSPAAFARGSNAVELVAVTGAGVARRYRRLGGGALGYRLLRAGDRQTIVDDSGRRIAVIASLVGGHVDRLSAGDSEVRIEGWAGDTERPRAADRVIAFAGDRLLAAGPPSQPRDDLARKFGQGLANAGFRLSGSAAGPRPGSPRAPIRVYAVIGRRASLIEAPGAR